MRSRSVEVGVEVGNQIADEIRQRIRLMAALPSPKERRELREKSGISQRDLAEILGVNPSTLLRWEEGESVPRRDSLVRYVEALATLREVAEESDS